MCSARVFYVYKKVGLPCNAPEGGGVRQEGSKGKSADLAWWCVQLGGSLSAFQWEVEAGHVRAGEASAMQAGWV